MYVFVYYNQKQIYKYLSVIYRELWDEGLLVAYLSEKT